MSTGPASAPRTADVFLLVGVALFVGGLCVFIGGLSASNGPDLVAGSELRAAALVEDQDRRGRPGAGVAVPRADSIMSSAGNDGDRQSARQRVAAHVPQDRPARSGQAPPGPVSVGWSSQWHLTLMGAEDDGCDYLTLTANARRTAHRNRSVMEWDDTTGYRAVEAARAAQDLGADVPKDRAPVSDSR